jgi:hypothetical protein
MSLQRSVNPPIWQFRARAHLLCAQGKVLAGLAGLNWLHENAILVNANLEGADLTDTGKCCVSLAISIRKRHSATMLSSQASGNLWSWL